MPNPRCHVAIDLETLGTSPDSVILAVGAVAICAETGNKVSFYSICNANAQPGRTVSRSTLDWWSQQNAEARVAFDLAHKQEAPLLANVLADLTSWLGDLGKTHDVFPWGNGATFDIAMLEHAYKQISDFVPWNFRKSRDMRTLYDLTSIFQLGDAIHAAVKREGVHHNALDDADYQARIVVESMRLLQNIANTIDWAERTAPEAELEVAV